MNAMAPFIFIAIRREYPTNRAMRVAGCRVAGRR
jgi:hypothetical protein